MFRNNKKILTLTISALILFFAFASTGYADSIRTTLTAQFASFKITMNDKLVIPKDSLGNPVSPLLVNDTTYLPIRAFGDLFNKNVDWNNTLKQISIKDKPDTDITGLKAQIKDKDDQIASLKAQVKDKDNQIVILKAQLLANESAATTLSDMQAQLNKNYKDYENLKVAIALSGTTSKVVVNVDIGSATAWSNLASSKQTRLIQNIADDINNVFTKPTISGTVKEGSKILNSFTVKVGGAASVGNTLSSLENTLTNDYKKIDNLISISNILLEGNEDAITYTVNVIYSESGFNKDTWAALSNSKIESYMNDIYATIKSTYKNADIEGYICDTNGGTTMSTLYMSGTSLKFRRYLP